MSRFHVVSLPHTQTTKEYLPCAYTQKVINFCKMMMGLGHEVFLYGSEDNDAPCTEFITCIKKADQVRNNWRKEFFAIQWRPDVSYWATMNSKAILEIGSRIQKKDFICLIGGNCQKPIADAFPWHISVEFGVGYEGVFSKFRVFESNAWMHYIYGRTGQQNGSYYDAVIHNYFDPEDFPVSKEKGDYYLFIGRLISRKGAHIAAEACNRIGAKLILAGQGVVHKEDGKIVAEDIVVSGNVEHVGTVDAKKRGELMSRARAVFVPTQYIGPFEGVHAEAMMCGTPVITTDWGVFTETVINGFNGYRTRTLGEMIEAAILAPGLDSLKIREYAKKRFSIDSVKGRYDAYFKRLSGLWDDGWYSTDASTLEERSCSCLR